VTFGRMCPTTKSLSETLSIADPGRCVPSTRAF
jgi:hypothetical protein